MPILDDNQKLKKELGLFDVFAVSTGAMFSSGFFLLPGLAAAKAGPAVVIAYLIAGIIILPAMFSVVARITHSAVIQSGASSPGSVPTGINRPSLSIALSTAKPLTPCYIRPISTTYARSLSTLFPAV